MNFLTQRTKVIPFFYLLVFSTTLFSQGFKKDDILASLSVGVPHLDKMVVKANTHSEGFKVGFKGTVSNIVVKGINPIAIKYEYAISKHFSLGFSVCWYSIFIDLNDNYTIGNAPNSNSQTDTYNYKISSLSFGIRPNYHIPLKFKNMDLFIGCAIGLTKNKFSVDFTSTYNNSLVLFYEFSMPNRIYYAPTLGYRVFLKENMGLNFELGYEKGALLQAGLVFRFRPLKYEPPK